MMKKIILGCLFAALALNAPGFVNESLAQERATRTSTRPKDKPKRATRRKAAPASEKSIKGATVTGNSVQLQRGYRFAPSTGNTISVQEIQSNNTVGTFQCNCLNEGGKCYPKVRGTRMKCTADSECSNNCQIRLIYGSVTEPGKVSQ